jgi:alpha-beta hydrolase superfamily lysophospholipase
MAMKMATGFAWRAHDGEELHGVAWRREGARGAVVCVHGLSGAGEQFEPVAMAVRDFSFFAMELRGQGNDPVARRRGRALELEKQVRDIGEFVEFVRRENGGRPVFLMGESMGALLAASFAAERGGGVDGLVLSVPVVGLRREVPRIVKKALRLVAGLAPHWRLPPSRFVNGTSVAPRITRNKEYQDSLRQKPHHITDFTLGFLSELGELIDGSGELATRLNVPVLVLAAGRDCFVRREQIEMWFEGVAEKEKTLHIYDEAFHLLWHDWDRDRVLQDLSAWFDAKA